MYSRNMKEANGSVFAALDRHCAAHNDPIANAGTVRWVASSEGTDRRRLKHAKLISSISFAASLKLARFDMEGVAIFCAIGLDLPDELDFLVEELVDGGMLVAALYELKPLPNVSTAAIRDVVEVFDSSHEPDYRGHGAAAISGLYPAIRCFTINDLTVDETDRIFFKICLSDTYRATLWMSAGLRETLSTIADLSPVAIPYRTLCRSVFETDPSALFMALYRCLEALYAYSHTKNLMNSLGINKTWSEVAEVLEDTLGWRPREEQSLGTLLRIAVQEDLRSILAALKEPPSPDADLVNCATKRIYLLRNSIVHYRPFLQSFDAENVDWNTLCEKVALIVLDVYHSVSTPSSSQVAPLQGGPQ